MENNRRYESLLPTSREEAERTFQRGPKEEIATTLVQIALYDPDWRWVQNYCLHFAADSDENVRRIAAVCLSHLARIHHQLDVDKVEPVLHQLLEDPSTQGAAQDALEDLNHFLSGYLKGE